MKPDVTRAIVSASGSRTVWGVFMLLCQDSRAMSDQKLPAPLSFLTTFKVDNIDAQPVGKAEGLPRVLQ